MSLLATSHRPRTSGGSFAPDGAPPESETLSWVLRITVPFLIGAIYYLALVRQTGIPPRLMITTFAVLVLLFGIGPHGPLRARPGFGYVVALVIAAAGYALSSLSGPGAEASSNAQRFLVTFPLAIAAGYVLANSRRAMDYLGQVITAIALLTAVLALVEFGTGRSLFGRDAEFADYVRADSARAVVGAEHPLVLGVLLAIAIPFAYRGLSRWWCRWPAVLLLLAGIYATGSRGPLGVTLGMLALLAVPGLMRFLARHFGAVFFTVMVALGVLWYYASRVWQPETSSTDVLANSMEYRAAIYSLMPRILVARPFGYGIGDLPTGEWLIRSPNSIQDITQTVDSQWVLSAMRLGWVGVFLVCLVVVVAILALRRRIDFGLSLLIFTGSGTFLALDAWDGLGSLWMLLLGVCVRLLSYAPHSLEASPTADRLGSDESRIEPPAHLQETSRHT